MAELNLSDDLSFETKRKVREKMRLELFCNEDEFEEWLRIANYSNYADGEDEENIKIREDFRQEMKICLENTKKLQKDFKISFGLPILLVFREKGSIIGTASLRRDEHKVSACQVNTIAIAKDKRRQGLGKKTYGRNCKTCPQTFRLQISDAHHKRQPGVLSKDRDATLRSVGLWKKQEIFLCKTVKKMILSKF